MGNKKAIDFWRKKAINNPDEKTTKVNAANDYTQLDAAFIMQFADNHSDILDLASGSGQTINQIYDKINHIVAVEMFEEFARFIKKTDKISIVNQDIKLYASTELFDIVTMFGIVSYFDYNEIGKLYAKYYDYIKPNGKLIIKNQFGLKEDVLVSGYSEELNENYFSQYRYLENEKKILETIGYKNIEVFDIYPLECNRWDNTHFYAIVAEK
jgi:cyclopropane fatty-acyl-phospholipid synthase-like methyltransferase